MKERSLLWLSAVFSFLACCLLVADLYLRGRVSSSVSFPTTSTLPLAPNYKTLSIEELAMRFHHPNFYQNGPEFLDPVPNLSALYEMIRRGLIHRGLRKEEAEYLLGAPYNWHEDVPLTSINDWNYGTIHGTLTLTFGEDARLTAVLDGHDGEPDHARSDDLLAGK